MGRDILNLPLWRDGLQVPLCHRERVQQLQESSIDYSQQACTQDRVTPAKLDTGIHLNQFSKPANNHSDDSF